MVLLLVMMEDDGYWGGVDAQKYLTRQPLLPYLVELSLSFIVLLRTIGMRMIRMVLKSHLCVLQICIHK